MNVKQKYSLLIFLKRKKLNKDGKAPLYARITVDGLEVEISLNFKVLLRDRDDENKLVQSSDPASKGINKRITQAKADLERHFDLMQAKNGVAPAAMVKESYLCPRSGRQSRMEKMENLQLSESLDLLIIKYLKYCDKVKNAHAEGRTPSPEKQCLLNGEKESLEKEIKILAKKANGIFDKKEWQKTFFLTVNEFLLDFLQLAFTSHRSPNTLEKWMGRKRKYQDFMVFRYNVEDMPLEEMESSFIKEVYKHLLVEHRVIENTAMKYAQCIKELMDRAVSKKWIPANIYVTFKCRYEDTDKGWPTPAEIDDLINTDFRKKKLNRIRDIFIFQCFTSLSYAEVRKLGPFNIINGIDGKAWISTKRQKTGEPETLPLLPIAIQLLVRYKDHPVCVRRKSMLPVPSCEEFNRCLKEIGKNAGIVEILTTHTGRYYCANEVLYNNGLQLKTVGKILGQKSIAKTAKYVKGNKRHISESMAMVEEKLFTKEGQLKPASSVIRSNGDIRRTDHGGSTKSSGARVVQMNNF